MQKTYKPATNDWFSLPIEPEYRPRFIPARDSSKLVNYYHLANTALDRPTRLERMQWACKWYSRENPTVSATGAYKDLCGLLGF